MRQDVQRGGLDRWKQSWVETRLPAEELMPVTWSLKGHTRLCCGPILLTDSFPPESFVIITDMYYKLIILQSIWFCNSHWMTNKWHFSQVECRDVSKATIPASLLSVDLCVHSPGISPDLGFFFTCGPLWAVPNGGRTCRLYSHILLCELDKLFYLSVPQFSHL